jgi:hypothetical protein
MAYAPYITTAVIDTNKATIGSQYGKNLIFIGESEKGPTGTPVSITTPKAAINQFGSGKIVDAFLEAYAAGAESIYLYRLNQDGEVLDAESKLSRLETAMEIIIDYPMHIIVPVGMYFDDEIDYAELLMSYCSSASNYGETIVLMSASPVRDDENLDQRITRLYKSPKYRQVLRDEDGEDCGFFLSVVLTQIEISINSAQTIISDGLATYAALIATLTPGVNPVNKSVSVISDLRHLLSDGTRQESAVTLSESPRFLERRPLSEVMVFGDNMVYDDTSDYEVDYEQGTIRSIPNSRISGPVNISYWFDDRDTLASVGVVTFNEFVFSGVAPASAVTQSKNGIKVIQDVRAMQFISWAVKEIGEELFGQTRVAMSSLQQELNNFLADMEKAQMISNHECNVSRTGDSINVDLSVWPMYSVSEQSVEIRLPFSE